VAGVEYEPNGLFGEKVVSERGLDWARSVRGERASSALPGWLVGERSQSEDTGTSVVIPFFGPPGQTEESSPKEVCDAILKAANLWYWPAIQSKRLEIVVSRVENGQVIDESAADGRSGVSDFVKAWETDSDNLVDVVSEEHGVAERLIPVSVPGRRATEIAGTGHEELSAPARLRVIRIDDSTSAIHGSVALIRGPGMVVKYLRPPGLGADVPGFVGVFEAGNRYPTRTLDHERVERFLKAAEPPAHDEWDCHTDRIGLEYKQGACARLREMRELIASGVREVLGTRVSDNDDGPTKLSKKFDLPGDLPQPTTRLTMKLLGYDTRSEEWSVRTTMTVDRKIALSEWVFEFVVQVDNSFGEGIPLVIKSSRVESPSGLSTASNGHAHSVRVPSGTTQVVVHVIADASTTGLPQSMRDRVKVAVAGTATRI
jgi:RNA polymerase primary sigma factor